MPHKTPVREEKPNISSAGADGGHSAGDTFRSCGLSSNHKRRLLAFFKYSGCENKLPMWF